jgi:hypothetical protein
MVLSRGLVISLGVSALGCTLLFLYFRNKISGIERKVDVMFDLIQNHQFVQAEPTGISPNTVRREDGEWTNNNNNLDTPTNEKEVSAWDENAKSEDGLELIQVSEDDDDDDSEEISDSDEEEDDENIPPKLSLDKTEEMSLSISDIKKITVQETDKLQVDNTIELEEVDSLDEIDDDDDEDEDEDEDEETVTKKVTVIKEDDDDGVDYAKLKVIELKALAEAKGLSNYKSLKKSAIVELLKASE